MHGDRAPCFGKPISFSALRQLGQKRCRCSVLGTSIPVPTPKSGLHRTTSSLLCVESQVYKHGCAPRQQKEHPQLPGTISDCTDKRNWRVQKEFVDDSTTILF